MVRISKKEERRSQSPRKPKLPGIKTGSKKDNLPQGYKAHANAIEEIKSGDLVFIPKIK